MGVRALRLLLAALVLSALTVPRAIAADPYDVHVILEQTGAFAFFGAKQAEALHAIEMLVNSTGGIKGRPLRFVIHDDATNPQVAVQLVNQLSAQKVPVIVGPALSTTCSAVYPLVQQNGPVLFCFSPVVIPPARSYAFRAGPAIEDFQPVVVRYFANRGLKNIALITGTDATGQGFDQKMDSTLNRLEFRDVKLVAREKFNPADLSVAAQVARIKAARPDAVLTFTSGTAFGTLLHALYDSGIDVPVFGSGANMNPTQLQQYGGFMPKELIFNGAAGLVEDPAARPEVRHQQAIMFRAMKAAGLHVEIAHQLTWDPTMIVIDALRALGPGATAENVHQYLERQRSWTGVQGVYNFSTGDQAGIGESGAALFRYAPAKGNWELVATGPRYT
jgi:branched-chain amino acid transport system substrate-binding protein